MGVIFILLDSDKFDLAGSRDSTTMAHILTTKGYSVLKTALTPEQTKTMQDELTVAPKMNSKFATKAMMDAAKFKLYRESPTRWYVPRGWGKAT